MENNSRRNFIRKLAAMIAAGIVSPSLFFGAKAGEAGSPSGGGNGTCSSSYSCAGGSNKCGSSYECAGGGGKCGSSFDCGGR